MKITIFLLFLSNFTFAQYWGGQYLNELDIASWEAQNTIDYQGVYHFGESESESTLKIFFVEDYIVGQITYSYWDVNSHFWKIQHINLSNIIIDTTGELKSDQYSGEFIKLKVNSDEYIKGLRIDNPWTSWVEKSKFEVGDKIEIDIESLYSGKYPEASFKIITAEELEKMNNYDLKIMKNEIFARYGYVFNKGGKMYNYFNKQNWYTATHNDVSSFLTEIELYNINLIKKYL